MIKSFPQIEFYHIIHHLNSEADHKANEGVSSLQGGPPSF